MVINIPPEIFYVAGGLAITVGGFFGVRKVVRHCKNWFGVEFAALRETITQLNHDTHKFFDYLDEVKEATNQISGKMTESFADGKFKTIEGYTCPSVEDVPVESLFKDKIGNLYQKIDVNTVVVKEKVNTCLDVGQKYSKNANLDWAMINERGPLTIVANPAREYSKVEGIHCGTRFVDCDGNEYVKCSANEVFVTKRQKKPCGREGEPYKPDVWYQIEKRCPLKEKK